jgi:hypothetical protein
MQTTTIRNNHASATGVGIAIHDDQVVYLGTVGHRTSLKSIWGTLITANNKGLSGFGKYHLKKLPGTRYVQHWTALPESTATHLIVVAESAEVPAKDQIDDLSENGCYLLVFHPEGARHLKPRYGKSEEREALRKQVNCELQTHLVDRLNKLLSIPVLSEWGPYLWERGLGGRWDDKGLVALDTDGDCIAGYWVNPRWRWTQTIQKGLQEGYIQFPALPKVA